NGTTAGIAVHRIAVPLVSEVGTTCPYCQFRRSAVHANSWRRNRLGDDLWRTDQRQGYLVAGYSAATARHRFIVIYGTSCSVRRGILWIGSAINDTPSAVASHCIAVPLKNQLPGSCCIGR